jgi:site-specific recombinase XerD
MVIFALHRTWGCWRPTRNEGLGWFATALDLAGIEGNAWLTLWHTFASRMAMAAVDLKTVQEMMGHRTITMTARFAHLAPAQKPQTLESLARPR